MANKSKIQNPKSKINQGFTLIEMLIVIAVIGVLAVAVLSAINPVEQLRKARDTRRRSAAAELLNAIERYFVTHERNPVMTSIGADDTCLIAVGATEIDAADMSELTDDEEIKPEFVTRISDSSNFLYVGYDAATLLSTVCYQIESHANITKYNPSPSPALPNYCEVGGNSYVCLPE